MSSRPMSQTRERSHKPSPRNLNLLTLPFLCVTIAAGCDGDQKGDPELRAILDDGELSSLVQSALMAPPPATVDAGGLGVDASAAGGRPGMMTGGKGGPLDPGFPDAGAGGSTGMGGFAMGGSFGGFGGGVDADGGVATDAGPSGGKGGAPGGFFGPLGFWEFDDCNEFRTQLNDSSFNGNTAFRSVKTKCTDGVLRQGVTLPNATDIVYVPDQPNFVFTQGVTVAAWVKANKFGGVQTIFRKRDGLTSSMALVLNGKQIQFVIDRKGSLPVSVAWKSLKEGVFSHVAARYDGTELRLYIDGKIVVQKSAPGVIVGGEGPLLIGNDGFLRRFDGVLDNVWFAAAPASDDVILGLTCLPRAATLAATPANSGPVVAGNSFTFDLALTNNSGAACAPEPFFVFTNSFFPDLNIQPNFSFLTVASGQTEHIAVSVVTQPEAEPGDRLLSFQAQSNSRFNDAPATASATFVIAEPTGCRVKTSRELLIKHLSVVTDPVRTTFNQPGDARTGQWTFKHLMEDMAPTADAAPDMVEAMLNTWLSPQTINGFTVEARPSMQQLVLDNWPRTANGKLDLARPPLELEAIVNRFDLRNLDQGNAGEGRFVFGVLSPGGFPMEFTLILEYKLPAKTLADVQRWADAWHALGALPFPSEDYNAALAVLTERFVKRGVAPGRPNGSAISSVRTNEIALSFEWQLREFSLDATTGLLTPSPVDLTPDQSFNNSPVLAEWINANQSSIIAETHIVPLSLNASPFRGGAIANNLNAWRAPGADPEARFHFSLNTCNGCHSGEETGTKFLHITPRFPGGEATLSGFMTGTSVFDFEAGKLRTFNDLGRRNSDLAGIVCPVMQPAAVRTGAGTSDKLQLQSSARERNLRRGIQRVH